LDSIVLKVNGVLQNFHVFTRLSLLSVNVAKTNFILYSRVGKPNDINGRILFDNKHIVQVQEIRYLGFYIDCNVPWKCHSEVVTTKIAHGLGAIQRFKKQFNVVELCSRELWVVEYLGLFKNKLKSYLLG